MGVFGNISSADKGDNCAAILGGEQEKKDL